MPLEKLMADKEPVWKEIQQKYGLKDYKIDDLVQWSFKLAADGAIDS